MRTFSGKCDQNQRILEKNFDNFQLEYIAFAEKFAGFALKLKGVRLRTVDSDELLDFNMAEVNLFLFKKN